MGNYGNEILQGEEGRPTTLPQSTRVLRLVSGGSLPRIPAASQQITQIPADLEDPREKHLFVGCILKDPDEHANRQVQTAAKLRFPQGFKLDS